MSYTERLVDAMDTGDVAFVIVRGGNGRLAVTWSILEKHNLDNGATITAVKMCAIITMGEPELIELHQHLITLYN